MEKFYIFNESLETASDENIMVIIDSQQGKVFFAELLEQDIINAMKEPHSMESLKSLISSTYDGFNEEEFESFFHKLLCEKIIVEA